MDREKMLDVTLQQIEKQFGKGAVMKLGEHPMGAGITVIPSGSLALDIALGVGGIPRGRIIEVFGPEGSGKTTVCLHMIAEAQAKGGIAAFIDAEHALDPDLRPRARRQHRRAAGLAAGLRRAGARDRRHARAVGGARHRGRRLGGRARSAGRDRGRDGRHARRPAGAPDVPGHAEAGRDPLAVRHVGDLHQPAPGEDRRHVRLARDHAGRPRAEVLLVGPARRPQDREPQGRHGRRRLAHPGQGRQEQGGAAVPPVRVRHHVRQGHLARRDRSSTSVSSRRSSRRPAPGSRTRAISSARAARTRSSSSPSTPTSATRSTGRSARPSA